MIVLVSYLTKAIETAAEARCFGRLAVMYGMDVAHYVAQKTEIGVAPKPPDKDEKSKSLGFYEKMSKEFAAKVLTEIEQQ